MFVFGDKEKGSEEGQCNGERSARVVTTVVCRSISPFLTDFSGSERGTTIE